MYQRAGQLDRTVRYHQGKGQIAQEWNRPYYLKAEYTSNIKPNKRPMGLIAHLRNQFKSMNTFERSNDYICYKIGPVVLEEKIFIFRESSFAILLLSPNVKRCGLSIWTNLNPLYPRMLFAKFGWNWPSGSGEDENVKSLRQQRRRTNFDPKNSLEPSAQVS